MQRVRVADKCAHFAPIWSSHELTVRYEFGLAGWFVTPTSESALKQRHPQQTPQPSGHVNVSEDPRANRYYYGQ